MRVTLNNWEWPGDEANMMYMYIGGKHVTFQSYYRCGELLLRALHCPLKLHVLCSLIPRPISMQLFNNARLKARKGPEDKANIANIDHNIFLNFIFHKIINMMYVELY